MRGVVARGRGPSPGTYGCFGGGAVEFRPNLEELGADASTTSPLVFSCGSRRFSMDEKSSNLAESHCVRCFYFRHYKRKGIFSPCSCLTTFLTDKGRLPYRTWKKDATLSRASGSVITIARLPRDTGTISTNSLIQVVDSKLYFSCHRAL